MDQSTPPPLTTFSLFPKLPTEVRLMIWKLSLPGPRTVHLKQKMLKEPPGRWWERVRSDVAIGAEVSECEYEEDNIYDGLQDIEKLERGFQVAREPADRIEGGEQEQYDGAELFGVIGEVGGLEEEHSIQDGLHDSELSDDGDDAASEGTTNDGLEGVDRPTKLWGFMSETPMPAMLLACQESRDVALRIYQPCFSALGAQAQIYFDTHQDTLFIDHETFIDDYDDLPDSVKEYLAPSDLAKVETLAIETMGSYLDVVADDAIYYEDWMVDAARFFENVTKIIVVSDHITYGPQTHTGQKYIDLKEADFCQDGIDIYGRPRNPGVHEPIHGTFFLSGLRIDRLFIDWDRIIGRYWLREWELYGFWEAWKEDHPELNLKDVDFEFQVWIPAADEKLLLKDAALFEVQQNRGRWVSYRNDEAEIRSTRVPDHFFT